MRKLANKIIPKQMFQKKSDLAVAVVVLIVSALLITPIPTFLLDILIVVNIAFSLFLLLVGLYLANPLSLLSFPTILLLITLFRLGLNVGSARLILSKGEAGKVIEAFGSQLVQGDIVVGLIIFAILTVVQFVVISKGTSRISEVAARFALDSLPGKQMTIDADLRANIITPEQAKIQRDELRKESQLFGSMDGAMKFVQGDAIAGIFIIFVNIIGGMYVGVKNGLGFAEAVETYTKLTVGDGLVTQIPALLVSICAGIIVTRVSVKDSSTFGNDVAIQLFTKTSTLYTTGGLLALIAFIPGLPTVPFLFVGLVFLSSAYFINRKPSYLDSGFQNSSAIGLDFQNNLMIENQSNIDSSKRFDPLKNDFENADDSVIIYLDAGPAYKIYRSKFVKYKEWWSHLKELFYDSYGLELPQVLIQSSTTLAVNEYKVYYKGVSIDGGFVNIDSMLVETHPQNAPILGLKMIKEERHPIHKNKIIWCTYSDNHRKILDSAEIRSYDFFEFLVIKISEYFRCNPDLLISLTDTYVKLKNLEKKFPGVVEEILSKNMLDISRLTEVLLSFIRERICIKDFKEVLELVALHCSEVRNNSEGDEHKLEMQKLVNFARINKRRSLLQNFITE